METFIPYNVILVGGSKYPILLCVKAGILHYHDAV